MVVATDIGGTFTDVVLWDAERGLSTLKLPSTPHDYAAAVLAGTREVLAGSGSGAGAVSELLHSTTVATNAILERRGARIGVLTTRGFRDVLELGRMRLGQLYDLRYEKPAPLVSRRHVLEVDERVRGSGEVEVPLDREQARRAVQLLADAGVEAVAVCLLNSWVDPRHEQELGRIVADVAPGVAVTLSSDILPEVGEYERASTAVVNAYVQPLVGAYLSRLAAASRDGGIAAPLLVMQSSGGITAAARAARLPAAMIESGPAAGVIAAATAARRAGLANAISFDMGGTTAKASVIEQGQPAVIADYEVGGEISRWGDLVGGSGYALRLPAIDVAEVGAGGGSIARIDAGGALEVGPSSAGAVPGPACYRRGGTRATVTDANVVLGYISPEEIGGGSVAIDAEAAARAVSEQVAAPLGLDVARAAWAVHVVAAARMIGAIRAVTTDRGRDPREFTLIAFGGSGPVHATGIAELLGIGTVLVPPGPGVLSAAGLLVAERAHQYTRALAAGPASGLPAQLANVAAELRARARAEFAEEAADPDGVAYTWSMGVRYVGQGHHLTIDVAELPLDGAGLDRVRECFEAEHKRTYGHDFGGAPTEFVNVRLVATLEGTRVLASLPPPSRPGATTAGGPQRRRAYFGDRGWAEAQVLTRALVGDTPLAGPAIVEEPDATTVVGPGWTARRDGDGNLVVTRDGEVG